MAELDVRKLRVLRELDERGTIGAVAQAMHLTPSAVSQQLAALSREAGVALVEPVGRRVRLTGAARVLLQHAQQIFAQLEHAQADLAAYAEGQAGEVRVAGFAATLSGLVLPAVTRLRADFPRLRLRLVEADPPDSFAMLLRGEIDVVLGLESQRSPAATDRRFHRVPILADRFDVALPTDHPLAADTAVHLADLADEPWIFANSGTCRDISLAACAAAGFTPEAMHTIGDWEATFTAVALGMGVALVPRLASLPSRTGVAIRPVAGEPPRRHVFVAVRQGSQDAPQVAPVVAALTAVAAERAAEEVGAASGSRTVQFS